MCPRTPQVADAARHSLAARRLVGARAALLALPRRGIRCWRCHPEGGYESPPASYRVVDRSRAGDHRRLRRRDYPCAVSARPVDRRAVPVRRSRTRRRLHREGRRGVGEPDRSKRWHAGRAFDLVALRMAGRFELGSAVLPPGRYDRVSLTIDLERSSITWRTATAHRGSATRLRPYVDAAGLRITFPALSTDCRSVEGGGVLVVDFDLADSFRPVNPFTASAGFQFVPTARAADGDGRGAVTGTVVGDGGAAVPDAMVTLVSEPGLSLASTRADAEGNFRFAYVRPGTYDLVADAPLRSPYGRATHPGVVVTTPNETGRRGGPCLESRRVRWPEPTLLRRIGLPGQAREMRRSSGRPTQIRLDADTLVLNASGGGSEVSVQRTIPPVSPRHHDHEANAHVYAPGRVVAMLFVAERAARGTGVLERQLAARVRPGPGPQRNLLAAVIRAGDAVGRALSFALYLRLPRDRHGLNGV